jgi:amino acid adenylation domain-containing protein
MSPGGIRKDFAPMQHRSTAQPAAARLPPSITLETMRGEIAELAGVPVTAVGDDDDLVAVGLDSIGVMKLASVWNGRGVRIKSAELLERRTLSNWWELVSARQPAAVQPAAAGVEDAAEPFPLATMQYAYWVGRCDSQTLSVGCHYYFEFDGSGVDAARLKAAVTRLLQRHAMLRSRVLGDGRQQIMTESPWRLETHDLRNASAVTATATLESIRREQSNRRLEVDRGLGFDVQLTLLPDRWTRLHVNVDMLVADALSFRFLIDELARIYEAPGVALPAIQYSYRQYLLDKVRHSEPARSQAREYWTRRLDALHGAPQLPLAVAPASVRNATVVRREHRIGAAERAHLTERAREHGVTLAMVFATAFCEVLGLWSAEPQFVVNVPVFDRENLHPDVWRIAGDFTSSILLTVDVSGDSPFAEQVRRNQEQLRADAAHAAYSGVDVLRDLARRNPDAAATAASVVFTSAIGMGDLFSPRVRACFGRPVWMISQTAQVWLDHQVTELEDGLLLNWDAVEQVFPEGMLDAMFAAYVRLLDWLNAPDSSWNTSTVDLLPPEQRRVRDARNATTRIGTGKPLHAAFFDHAAARPDRLALAWGTDGCLSYGELSVRARQIAALLLQQGLLPGERVAITLPKGPAQVEAVLGVLCAGGVCVPIGIDQPVNRRRRIYTAAGSRLVLTTSHERRAIEWPDGLQPLAVDDSYGMQPLAAPLRVPPSSPAYVIFTSGSTGEPKGVVVPHSAAMNTIEDILSRFPLDDNDRVLSVSALDFDWSVADIFELLSVGGGVVLIDDGSRRSATEWIALIRRWRITVWQSVPALFDMLLTADAGNQLTGTLRLAMLGGDWVGLDLYGRVKEQIPDCRLIALGGITETAIHCTVHPVTSVAPQWRSIPYGVPLTNVKCRVVNASGRDCPTWVPGELWIGGAGVALGYLGDPERTEQRFVTHQNERWFRSGDLARYWPDGSLEFLGRADRQVKIRGQRIELGEIEAALRTHPGVAQAVAATIGGGTKLAAAVVASDRVPAEDLLSFAAEHLPAHMVPEYLIVLDVLPLTPNGKIDSDQIRRLLAHDAARYREVVEPPLPGIETAIARVWAGLLNLSTVGRNQSFFALGGDSLLATRMLSQLRRAGILTGDIRSLFSSPVLKDFAAAPSAAGAGLPAPSLVVDSARRHDPFPLTEIQRAYLMGRSESFTLGRVGSYWYWEFDGTDVDLVRLEQALDRLIARHEMMRAVVEEDFTQRVLPSVPRFRIATEDAARGEERAALENFREAMSHRQMDPAHWPSFDVRALRYGDRVRIGFGFDYIVLDALSICILFSELARLYKDPDAALPPIGVSFRDYVLSTPAPPETREAAERFWLQRAEDLPPAPQLPLAKHPSTVGTPRFVRREARLPVAAWRTIRERARRHDITPSAVLATAYAEVLSCWSECADITLNFTVFSRQDVHPDVNAVVGDFTSLLLVGYSPRAAEGWTAKARRLQEEIWRGLEHRSVSAIWVMREIARRRAMPGWSMPVVFTSTLGVADGLIDLKMPFGDYVGGLSQTPQVWLDCQVVDNQGELLVNWDAVEELFPQGVLDALFDAYTRLLNWAAEPATDWHAPLLELLPTPQSAVYARVNATSAPVDAHLLHARFFERAAVMPQQTALIFDGERMSYGDLAERALRIAALLQTRGVRPGDVVAIALPRGPDQIAAVLGVLAAGAAYVPVGVEQPPERRRRICANAGVQVVLDGLPDADSVAPLAAPIPVSADGLAYVIYTSGSTGEPKGVEMTHRAAMNTILAVNERFGVGETDRVLAISNLDFDLSVYDIFGLLSAGGSLVLIRDEDRRDARSWAGLVRRHGVTIWNSVPALLDMLATAASGSAACASLRLMLASGDWVPTDLPQRVQPLAPESRFVALGGATEAGIWSIAYEVVDLPPQARSVPYGYPLRNQQFRVVDALGRDCPAWVTGELWIGGASLARGYRGDAARTAQQFVEWNGRRWYRTGDRGRYWPDGTLEFIGRTDQQIKIRGYRIEFGEIEAALKRQPGVADAVAFIEGTSAARLAAAVVINSCGTSDLVDIHAGLAEHLPVYMIPDHVFAIDSIPLGPNGKVDRGRLARMALEKCDAGVLEEPQGELERQIAECWKRSLRAERVGRNQTFLASGGDSLSATELVETLRRQFGVDLTLRLFLEQPTVAGLAGVVDTLRREAASSNLESGVL